MLREKIYEWKNWKGVVHTTFNPHGPGVIRIHMIPPKFHLFSTPPAVVILNGQEILPVNESWAILLTEFLKQVNKFGPHEMSDSQLEDILDDTFYEVRKVYHTVEDAFLKEDLDSMLQIFETVIRGEIPTEDIGLMSLGDYAPYMRAPHRMDLMISAMEKDGKWHCNQKCLHCYAAGQEMSDNVELSTKEWIRIIEQLKKAGIPQLTFTGGEPTMRDDLCELISSAKWFVTRLNTNGILLTEELCEQLVKAELDSVQITFYSADEAIHNELVGGQHYAETVRGIKNAVKAGLNLSINTPLCNINRDYVSTLRFLHELGVEYVTCSGLIMTGNAAKDSSKETQLTEEQMERLLREASEYCFANGMEINFTSPGWVPEDKLKKMGLDIPSCGACLSNMAVTPDGKAVPCQSWLSGENYGDVRTIPWKKIWDDSLCKKHRAYSAKMLGVCPFREKESEK